MPVDLFSIGNSSLHTAKKSLSTTSHNISNANNEDFSRQRVTHETNNAINEGDYVLGNGVRVREIRRSHDALVEKKLNHSITNHSYDKERSYQLGRVEEVFNEVNNEGMNKVLNRFFNSFRELANRPEDEVVRTMVRDNAQIVVNDFKRINSEIDHTKDSIDRKITANVDVINGHAKVIAKLNVEIVRIENLGGESNDLRDKRDAAVRQIAEQFKINTYEDNKGRYTVNIVGAGTLVTSGDVNELAALKVPSTDSASRTQEGKVDIFIRGKNNHSISKFLKKGETQALLETRNSEIDRLREQIDDLAYNLAKTTNAIHRKGFADKEIPYDQDGNPIINGKNFPATNINFFKDPISKESASDLLSLSDEVNADLRNISTALSPNSPGDNRIAIAISKVQHEKMLGDSELTFEEHYLEAVGTIGLTTAKSKINEEQSGGILAQAKSVKSRISGVSLDEESANLIRYQHQYDASARVIKVADEMFDSVLGMMR